MTFHHPLHPKLFTSSPNMAHFSFRLLAHVEKITCKLTDAATLVRRELKPRPALAGNPTFGRLSADVGAAVLLVHAAQTFCKEEVQLEGKKHGRQG